MANWDRRLTQVADVRSFVGGVYAGDLLPNGLTHWRVPRIGVMRSASLAVAMIGQALAKARGLVTKHTIKQVDRMMSNNGIDVWD